MFFFFISLSVFVSNLEGLFLLFIVQTFRFLCSHFRKVIRIEFSPFHDFVDILFIGFGMRVFPPFLSHLSPFLFLIIPKMLFYRLKIAETNREAIFDTPLLYLCDKALILRKLWIFLSLLRSKSTKTCHFFVALYFYQYSYPYCYSVYYVVFLCQ